MDPQAPETLAALMQHTYQEGERALQQQQDGNASIWFSQCLLLLRSLPGSIDWVSTLLFNLGRLKALLRQPEQAVGFLEASANTQLALPQQGEAEGDVAQAVGAMLDMVGYPAQGQYFLERAQRTYQACGVPAKARAAEQQARQFATKYKGTLGIAPIHRFEIRVGSQIAGTLSVSAEGKIEWGEGEPINPPPALGVSIPWQAVCTTC
ncbi:MAG: hypothetical protein H0T73_20320 [Ardenticatenales bacterium]|nr:hypothetical protein [Ardenticatenales bacterium]